MLEKDREAMIQYRIKRAKETLNEVDILIRNELWITAINRLYYACFYAATALLIKNKIQTKSHAGVRQMLGLHFIKTNILPKYLGRFYTILFDMRIAGDYDDFVEYSQNDVLSLVAPAKEFITHIESLIQKDGHIIH